MDASYPIDGLADVEVNLAHGSLQIRALRDHNEVRVSISGAGADRFRIDATGSKITVAPPPRERLPVFGWGRHDVLIEVPEMSTVHAGTSSADITTSGALAQVRAVTSSGRVALERADGEARVEAASGAVMIGRADIARVSTASGSVRITTVGNVDITTGSGRVELGRVGRRCHVKTGSGAIQVERLGADGAFSTASGAVTIGSIEHGRLDAATSSGAVRIGVPSGVAVWTDIASAHGKVTSTLPSRGEPAPGQPYVELRVTTSSGRIRLEPAITREDALHGRLLQGSPLQDGPIQDRPAPGGAVQDASFPGGPAQDPPIPGGPVQDAQSA